MTHIKLNYSQRNSHSVEQKKNIIIMTSSWTILAEPNLPDIAMPPPQGEPPPLMYCDKTKKDLKIKPR